MNIISFQSVSSCSDSGIKDLPNLEIPRPVARHHQSQWISHVLESAVARRIPKDDIHHPELLEL